MLLYCIVSYLSVGLEQQLQTSIHPQTYIETVYRSVISTRECICLLSAPVFLCLQSTPRVPDPPKDEGHYPSEIQQLLRDYGRAREEACSEIARARDRLRQRTELEKRRLQQQAMAVATKVRSQHPLDLIKARGTFICPGCDGRVDCGEFFFIFYCSLRLVQVC